MSEPRVGEGRNVSLPVGALEGLSGIVGALERGRYFNLETSVDRLAGYLIT